MLKDVPTTSGLAVGTEEPMQQGNNHPDIATLTGNDTDPVQTPSTTPADIIPLPKIKIKRKRKGKGLKSELVTSTPNKERLENEAAEKEKQATEKEQRSIENQKRAKENATRQLLSTTNTKRRKKNTNEDSSDTDADYWIYDSSSDGDFIGDDDGNDQVEGTENSQDDSALILPNDYAVVKVDGKTKNCFRHFVANIVSFYQDGYDVVFYKRLPNTYKFSETNEESFVEVKDVVLRFSKPIVHLSARFHNVLSFNEDLNSFRMF